MTREQEIQFTELFKEKLKDAQFQGLASGAKGISGAILEICKEKGNDTVKIDMIRKMCEAGLGLNKDK